MYLKKCSFASPTYGAMRSEPMNTENINYVYGALHVLLEQDVLGCSSRLEGSDVHKKLQFYRQQMLDAGENSDWVVGLCDSSSCPPCDDKYHVHDKYHALVNQHMASVHIHHLKS